MAASGRGPEEEAHRDGRTCEAGGVRHGIVEGEPGIFPWPMGWLSRLRRRRKPPDAGETPPSGRPGRPSDQTAPGDEPGRPAQPPPPGQVTGNDEAGRPAQPPPPGQVTGSDEPGPDVGRGEDDRPGR
jgi:hypothetical protein